MIEIIGKSLSLNDILRDLVHIVCTLYTFILQRRGSQADVPWV